MTDDLDLTYGGADGAWLRAQLDPIVAAPVEPALDAIWQGAETGTTRRRRGPSSGVLALAAAAIVLLVVATVVAVHDRGDDPDDRVATTLPEATGWYVPQGLPEGWTLGVVEATRGSDPTCAGEGASWTDAAGTQTIGLVRSTCGELPTDPFVPGDPGVPPDDVSTVVEVDLGGGTTGTAFQHDGELSTGTTSPLVPTDRLIAWPAEGGGTWTLRTVGVDEATFLDAARALAADPTPSDGEVAAVVGTDVVAVDRWTTAGGEASTSVQLQIASPDGHQLALMLSPPGQGTHPEGGSIAIPEDVDGQPLPVWRYDDPSWAVRYGGAWPGADVSVMRVAQDPADWIDDDQLGTFIASLRPASAAEWRAYLATATGPVDEEASTAPTLAELFDAPSSSTPTPTTATGPLTSPPGTEEPMPAPADAFSDLTGVTVRLEVDAAEVSSGAVLGARLRWSNATDLPTVVNECTWQQLRIGLVAMAGPDLDPPAPPIGGCSEGERFSIPANGALVTDLEGRLVALAEDGDPLLPGGYVAVVLVPGDPDRLRVELPVTVTAP